MKVQSQLFLVGVTSTLAWGLNISPSSAVNFIGNLPSNDGSSTILSSGSGTNVKAVSFTLGSGSDYSLDNAVLRLDNYDASDSFSVQIRDDGGTNPGSTILANLSLAPGETPQGNGINAYYTFNPNSSFTFQQNTKYWLYLSIAASSGGTGSFIWRSSLPSTAPVGIADYGAYRFSNNGGTSFTNSSILNSFQINATEVTTAVPEPLTILGSLTAVGFGAAFKRRLTKVS